MLFDRFLEELQETDLKIDIEPTYYGDGEIYYQGAVDIPMDSFSVYFGYMVIETGHHISATRFQPSEWVSEKVSANVTGIEVYEYGEGHRLQLDAAQEEKTRKILEKKIEKQLL